MRRNIFPARAPALTLPRMDDVVDTMAGTSDESLMLGWVSGDAGAFEALYGRHRQRLYRFLLRQLRDGALADELFQDVWQKVIAAREGWRPEARSPGCTASPTTASPTSGARSNRSARAEDADERAERVPDPDTPERQQLSDFEQRRRLQLALDELPPEQREVILLRLEQEISRWRKSGSHRRGPETVSRACATPWTSCARNWNLAA